MSNPIFAYPYRPFGDRVVLLILAMVALVHKAYVVLTWTTWPQHQRSHMQSSLWSQAAEPT